MPGIYIFYSILFILLSILGYTESLTLDQQVTIIEQSWLDTLLLDIIERSLERNDDTLHFAPDFIVSRYKF
jgi:hypothetical protein